MYLKTLSMEGFRNYEKEFIEFSPYTNVFYGNNAQGKTNILEAVYLFSHGRSHKARSDTELVRFGDKLFSLGLEFADSERDYTASIRFSADGKKSVRVNNVPITKLSRLMNYLNVVMFSPEDLEIVKGSPSVRRHFMDEAISQLYPNYLSRLINYNKALLQKNSLLKTLKGSSAPEKAMLSVWNEQLAELAAVISKYRYDFLSELNALAQTIHKDISKEMLLVEYAPNVPCDFSGSRSAAQAIYEKFERCAQREIETGTAQAGIQRDDIKISLDGRETRVFSSQGQQRTAVLSLKIAETEYIKSVREEYPVLLLDDIMSELDISRRKYLSEQIQNKQVLITCTDTDIAKSTDKTRLFCVSSGRIAVK